MDEYDKYIDLLFSEYEDGLTEDRCPVCDYPIVIEAGLEVCYSCGWYRGMEEGK
jgi:hypothetical protein